MCYLNDPESREIGGELLVLNLLARTPLLRVLSSSLGTLYPRMLAHAVEGILTSDSRRGASWYEGSVLSWLMEDLAPDALEADESFLRSLADERVRDGFSSMLVRELRDEDHDFGRCCLVDTMELPVARGEGHLEMPVTGDVERPAPERLRLVVERSRHLPVSFEYARLAGGDPDVRALEETSSGVEGRLHVTVNLLDLAACYAGPELFCAHDRDTYVQGGGRAILVGMPEDLSYPYLDVFRAAHPGLHDIDNLLDHGLRSYTCQRFEREVCGHPEYCHVLLDEREALDGGRLWREHHPGCWETLPADQKRIINARDGLTMLVGNDDVSPSAVLVEHLALTDVEAAVKDGRAYRRLLPSCGWTIETILGATLILVVREVARATFRRELDRTAGRSVTDDEVADLLERLSLYTCKRREGNRVAMAPDFNARDMLEGFGIKVPWLITFEELASYACLTLPA